MLPEQAAAWPDSLGESFLWLMVHSFLEEVDWLTNLIQGERLSSDIWGCCWQLRVSGMKKDDTQWIRRSLGFETGALLHTQTHTSVHIQVTQQLCEAFPVHHGPQEPTQ